MRLPSNLTYNDLNGEEARAILSDWFVQFLSTQPALQAHLTLPNAKLNLEVAVSVEMYIGGTVPIESPPEMLVMSGAVELNNATKHLSDFKMPLERTTQSTSINAAPIPGGNPPDRIREQHNLPIPTPGYGPRETGSHLFLGDVTAPPQVPFKQGRGPDVTQSSSGGREGVVADGYIFSDQVVTSTGSIEQTIPVDNGQIEIDLTGQGKMRQGGMVVTAGTHRLSKKEAGDGKGKEYGSVTGTYDPGPAGLAQSRNGGGLGMDGRSRIRFGNNH